MQNVDNNIAQRNERTIVGAHGERLLQGAGPRGASCKILIGAEVAAEPWCLCF